MFTIKRNSVIITALVIMVAFAGYLNYIDRANENEAATTGALDQGGISVVDETGQELSIITNDEYDEDFFGGDSLLTGDAGSDPLAEGEIDIAVSDTTEDEPGEPGKAVFVNSNSGSSYFVQAKLTREQNSSKEKETLMDLVNNTNLEKAERAAYAEEIRLLQQNIKNATDVESMIEAKGFAEVFVNISDLGVEVIVSKSALTDTEVAQIEDIVTRKTGFTLDKVTISPVKS